MPNWCNNQMDISGTKEMMDEVESALKEGELFAKLLPIPAELNITAGSLGHNTPEQLELEEKEKANREKYGYANWYDYCVNEWGTKWDISLSSYERLSDTEITLSFDTAWAPPIVAYEKLVDLGYEIRAYYYEPGMAFCGRFEDGFDEYYEIGGMSADEVEAEIPAELDEMFCIVEEIRNYEEEENQETE
jgi:hypothetical protein